MNLARLHLLVKHEGLKKVENELNDIAASCVFDVK